MREVREVRDEMTYRGVATAGSDDVESIRIGDSGGTSQDLRSHGRYEGGE